MWSLYFGQAEKRKELEKSYVSTYSSEFPVQNDLTLYQLFQRARENGDVGEIINLETGESLTTTHIMDKVIHCLWHTRLICAEWQ